MTDPGAGNILLKQLAFENANEACKKALQPHRQKGTVSGFIRICQDIGEGHVQGLAMAAALKEVLGGNKQSCFNCGKPGHFAKEWRAPQRGRSSRPTAPVVTPSRASGICLQCGWGKHWANECHSKKDA